MTAYAADCKKRRCLDGKGSLIVSSLVIGSNCLGSVRNGEEHLPVSEDSVPRGVDFSRYENSSPNACVPQLCIGTMSPTRLSLSMVASLQSPLPFYLARSL